MTTTDHLEARVSVGIPTFNRPQGLKKTLECIAGQTYGNIEIIVSDNASSDRRGVAIAEELSEKDPRVRVYCQRENIGPLANFEFVLEQATGEFFMWAADDDRWQPWFVERCVEALEHAGSHAAAAVSEAQYFTESGPCDFFAEGKAFYGRTGLKRRDRLRLMLDDNYGNLFYSVYRRKVLFLNGVPLFTALGLKSLNEIPLLLYVAAQGDWIVLPEIGLAKQTRMSTYYQARWEKTGGRLHPECRARSLESLSGLYRYHASALREITRAIRSLDLSRYDATELEARARRNIWLHLVFLAFGYRPPK